MKRVFVIGGAGFIGSHLVARLMHVPGITDITAFDNESSGSMSRIADGPGLFKIVGNARDFDFLRVAMASQDTVFHLAANPDIARAAKEPTIDFEQGTVLTNNVLEAMRVNGVKRLIYTSGSGVYGDTREALREDMGPLEPISTYGASKLASEGLISAYCAMFGIVARVLRPANIVGPRQTHGVGFDFLRKLKADPTKLVILGDGQQTKSYIYVDDVIDAMLLLIDRCICDALDAPVPYACYNIASGDVVSVNEIARMAIAAAWLDEKAVKIEHTGGTRGWLGDVPRVYFNCQKLHALGWRPKRNSREAIRDSLEAMAKEIS